MTVSQVATSEGQMFQDHFIKIEEENSSEILLFTSLYSAIFDKFYIFFLNLLLNSDTDHSGLHKVWNEVLLMMVQMVEKVDHQTVSIPCLVYITSSFMPTHCKNPWCHVQQALLMKVHIGTAPCVLDSAIPPNACVMPKQQSVKLVLSSYHIWALNVIKQVPLNLSAWSHKHTHNTYVYSAFVLS